MSGKPGDIEDGSNEVTGEARYRQVGGIMQIVAAAVPILFLVFLGFSAWKGELNGRSGVLRRDENPITFWATIGLGVFFCLLALAGSLRALSD